MAQGDALDARERPPAFIKSVYKFYRKLSKDAFTSDAGILDLSLGLNTANCSMVKKVDKLLRSTVYTACCHLRDGNGLASTPSESDVEIYEAENIPGQPPVTLGFKYGSLTPIRLTSNPISSP